MGVGPSQDSNALRRPEPLTAADMAQLPIVPHSTYALMALHVYNEPDQRPLPPGWKVLVDCSEAKLDREGYFATAYVNDNLRVCVVAERGTSDALGIRASVWMYFDEPTIQFALAEQFSKIVRLRLQLTRDTHANPYVVSYTGHSLGAVIAACRACAEHTFAVTFESPGCRKFVEHTMHPFRAQDIDVITYLRQPNPVNTLRPQCGYLVHLPYSPDAGNGMYPVVSPSGGGHSHDASSGTSAHAINSASSTAATISTQGAVVGAPAAQGTQHGLFARMLQQQRQQHKEYVDQKDGGGATPPAEAQPATPPPPPPVDAKKGKGSPKSPSKAEKKAQAAGAAPAVQGQSNTAAAQTSSAVTAVGAAATAVGSKAVGAAATARKAFGMPAFSLPTPQEYLRSKLLERTVPELQQYLSKVEPVLRELLDHTQQVHSIAGVVDSLLEVEANPRMHVHEVILTWPDHVMQFLELFNVIREMHLPENQGTHTAAAYASLLTRLYKTETRSQHRIPASALNTDSRALLRWWHSAGAAAGTPNGGRSVDTAAIASVSPAAAAKALETMDRRVLNSLHMEGDVLVSSTLTAFQAKQFLAVLAQRPSVRTHLDRFAAKLEAKL